jgi:hypothetical protein
VSSIEAAQDQGELFPVVGDRLNHGGLSWRVVDREPSHVVFVVEGLEEPARRITLRQWQRMARRAEVGAP